MSHKNPQQEEKVKGLLLHSLPHLGNKHILKILTAEHGLVTLIGRSSAPDLLTPFHMAEWVYWTGRGEMGKLIEGSIEERFPFDQYAQLESAGKIAADLLRTQLPSKQAEAPLALAHAYLKALKGAKNPEILPLSFRLKLLQAEGLFSSVSEEALQILAHSRSFIEIQAVPFTTELGRLVEQLFNEHLR